jgi:hypothetical protein
MARWARVFGVAALLLLAVTVASGQSAVPNSPLTPSTPAAEAEQQSGGGDPPVAADAVTTVAGTTFLAVVIAAALFGAALLLVVLAGLVRYRRRRRVGRIEPPGVPDEGVPDGDAGLGLRRAVETALTELAAAHGGPPSDAVITAWLRLEEAAARAGTPRRPHQTPTEFTAAVLAEHTADQAAVTELCRLYQRARFSTGHVVGRAEADAALAALDRIAQSMRVGSP